jgi:predicted NBD/HSP70 family sugar kinase
LAETGLDLSTTLGPDVVLRTVADGLSRLRDKVDRPVRGIGLCLPGPVDAAAGTVVESPLLPGWGGVPITLGFPDVPVLVDNDVNALTLAERTARQGVSDLLHVKVSTGIGAGIIAGGALQRGVHGAAGEIGHNPVADGGGVVCRCGNSTVWRRWRAVPRWSRRSTREDTTSPTCRAWSRWSARATPKRWRWCGTQGGASARCSPSR